LGHKQEASDRSQPTAFEALSRHVFAQSGMVSAPMATPETVATTTEVLKSILNECWSVRLERKEADYNE